MPQFPVRQTFPDSNYAPLGTDAEAITRPLSSVPPRPSSNLASRAAKSIFRAGMDQLRIKYTSPSKSFHSYRWKKSVHFHGDKNLQDKASAYPDTNELNLYAGQDRNGGQTEICSPESLRDISFFRDLKIINLHGDNWTDEHLQVIVQHPNLLSFGINTPKEDYGAKSPIFEVMSGSYSELEHGLSPYFNRRNSELPSLQITDRGIEAISRSATINRLELADCKKLTDDSLRHIGKMRALRTLGLISAVGITNDGLRHLQSIPNLYSLNLNGFTACGLNPMHRSGYGEWSQFDGAGIQAISTHKNLQQLSLANCVLVTDDDLQTISANFRLLNSLNLQGCCQITTAGVANLQGLQHLTALNLTYTQIDDEALILLLRLPRLKMLSISHCHRLTTNIGHILKDIKNLQYLNVDDCSGVNTSKVYRVLHKQFKHLEFPERDSS